VVNVDGGGATQAVKRLIRWRRHLWGRSGDHRDQLRESCGVVIRWTTTSGAYCSSDTADRQQNGPLEIIFQTLTDSPIFVICVYLL
jgi:hypothetical protein